MSRGRGAGPGWRVWIDTGGTFTDCLAIGPDGALRRAKVLSSSALRGEVVEMLDRRRLRVRPVWEVPGGFFTGCSFHLLGGTGEGGDDTPVAGWADGVLELAEAAREPPTPGARFEIRSPEEAPVLAARLVTGAPPYGPLPPMALRLATTRGTNALLERRGAPTGLLTSRGFADLLEIGDQQRPELFALAVVKPRPLYRLALEVEERLDAAGRVLVPLAEADLDRAAERLREAGVEAVAVAFLHSYRNPEPERRAAERLRAAGFRTVVASAELAPLIKIVPRAETAVVEAYLAPILEGYLDGVAAHLPAASSLHVMTSAGGLVRRSDFHAVDGLLSGPVGGVAGAARAAARSGFERLISFDMGGTSTDVARWAGDHEYRFEHRVGDARLVAPALAIETVAAGGGSVCGFDGAALTVGPQSAGARPGPACYGDGGPLTLTDVNLLLGRLDPERFGIPVDEVAAATAFDELAERVRAAELAPAPRAGRRAPGNEDAGGVAAAEPTGDELRERLLDGFLAIADERMADAIRSISVRRGYDPAEHVLVAFGGAGGQHAAAVAALLGIGTVLVPPDAGLLSAFGLGVARVERFAQRQVLARLTDLEGRLGRLLAELAAEAVAAVAAEGIAESAIELRRTIVYARFIGQETSLPLEPPAGEARSAELRSAELRDLFAAAYRERYGYLPEAREIEVESIRVVASSRAEAEEPVAAEAEPGPAEPVASRRVWLGDSWRETPVYERSRLAPGAELPGPALVFERHGATVVPPGWQGTVDAAGALRLRATTKGPTIFSAPEQAEP